jgi:hypothetical protein
MSLYEELLAAGATLAHHESDLYVLSTPTARDIIARHALASTFIGHDDGQVWHDVPFAYDPFWASTPRLRLAL